jgi:hypothetical protein
VTNEPRFVTVSVIRPHYPKETVEAVDVLLSNLSQTWDNLYEKHANNIEERGYVIEVKATR